MPDYDLIHDLIWKFIPDIQIPIWVCGLFMLITGAVIWEIFSIRKHR